MSFAELILDPVFRLIVFAIIGVIGIIIGWTLRAKFPEQDLQRALERNEQEKSTLARLYAHLRHQHDLREADLKRYSLELDQLRGLVSQLENDKKRMLPAEQEFAAQLAQAQAQTQALSQRLQALDQQNRQLLHRNEALNAELNRLQAEIRAWETLYNDFKNMQLRLSGFEEHTRKLERERDELRLRLAGVQAESERLQTELLRQINERTTAKSKKGGPAVQTDDLKLINGISPVMEQQLFALGVKTLEHIAAWDDDTIIAIAKKLGISPGKIFQEDWCAQARQLMGSR